MQTNGNRDVLVPAGKGEALSVRALGRGCSSRWSACRVAVPARSRSIATGPQFCPRDVPTTAPRMTEAQAIERAQHDAARDFCGPSVFVSGCDADAENRATTRGASTSTSTATARAARIRGGLTHTYVILDPVGNCLANIPGTELGAPN